MKALSGSKGVYSFPAYTSEGCSHEVCFTKHFLYAMILL